MARLSGAPQIISSGAEARELARRILSDQRPEPFVIITTPRGRPTPWFDAEAIATKLRFRADVWIVPDKWSWDLNLDLDPESRAHSGAAVIHPPAGVRPRSRLLFVARSAADAERLQGEVVANALAHTRGAARRAAHDQPAAVSEPAAHPSVAPSGVRRPTSSDEVDRLAEHLLDPERDVPVCVVTIPVQRDEPFIDAEEIAAISPEAEVYLLPTGALTFALSRRLNAMAGVYGGAGRVYPPGRRWMDDPYTSVLRFAYNDGEGQRATDGLLNDMLSGLVRSGRMGSQTPAHPPRPAKGVVAGLLPPSRALVTLEDGQMATIWAELVDPDLTIDALVAKDMAVSGLVDPVSRRIDVSAVQHSWQQAFTQMGDPDLVLTLVRDVSEASVTLSPYPGVEVAVPAEEVTGNQLDDLRDLFTRGERVAARVVGRPLAGAGPGADGWAFSLIDVDDDENPFVATILPGGPPWLSEPATRGETAAPQPDVEDSAESARLAEEHQAAATRLSEVQAQAEASTETRRVAELEEALVARDLQLEAMAQQLRGAARRVERLEAQVEHQKTLARQAQSRARKGRGPTAPSREVHGFLKPEQQLRWDIQRTWVDSTRPEDKSRWALRPYQVGPDFCESLEKIEGVSRERVLAIACLLLTGRGVRDDHENRTSDAGNAPPVTRFHAGQTWVCRRAPLQAKTPSARRLSYWRGDDGSIELSRIVLHDDYTP